MGTDVVLETDDTVKGLRSKDGEVDVVFCNQTLVHTPQPVEALREMRRVCKEDGQVAAREGGWLAI